MSEAVNSEPAENYSFPYWGVTLLVIANLINYLDRTVLSVLLPGIQEDLHLTDSQIGWVAGLAFAFFYATFGIPIARLADVWTRKHIISFSLLLWSSMTALSGLAFNFVSVFLARMGVGIGEAGCIPASHSLISDMVKPAHRAMVIGWHSFGATIGMMAGLALGGWLAEAVGWRWTFVILGLPGIALAITVHLTFKEPKRGRFDPSTDIINRANTLEAITRLLKNRTYTHLLIAFGTSLFASYGVMQWLPMHYVRTYEVSISTVGVFFGLALGGGGAIGALAGGYCSTFLMKRSTSYGALYAALALTLSQLLLIVVLLSDSMRAALAANFFQAMIAASASAPLLALIQNVSKYNERALAIALAMFCSSLMGLGLGPLAVGYLSELFSVLRRVEPLRDAMLLTSVIPIWSVLHILVVARRLTSPKEMAQR